MRAAVCREFGADLSLENVDLGDPQTGEVAIKILACAICHSDITYIDGGWGGALPSIYGHEAVGIIDKIGNGVRGFAKGDRVVVTLIRSCGHCMPCNNKHEVLCETQFDLDQRANIHDADHQILHQGLRTGAFAQYCVVDQSQIVGVPDSMPSTSAALLACGVITGIGGAIHVAQVQPGTSCVVIGVGGVGMNAIQGAHIAGAHKIIAVDIVADKLTLATQFGATDCIDAARQDAQTVVQSLTAGRGADHVLVAVGAARVMEQAVDMCRPGGCVTLLGMPPTGSDMTLDVGSFSAASKTLRGAKMGSSRIAIDIPYLVDLYGQGRLELDALVSQTYAFEDINTAIANTRTGQNLRNVLVMEDS